MTYLKEIRPRVRAHPLFVGLSADDVKTPAEHARPVAVASGLLFEQGGDADGFWLLESGRSRSSNRNWRSSWTSGSCARWSPG